MSNIEVQVPEDIAEIKKQIKALELQIQHDINTKDREIHQEALQKLENKRMEMFSDEK